MGLEGFGDGSGDVLMYHDLSPVEWDCFPIGPLDIADIGSSFLIILSLFGADRNLVQIGRGVKSPD
jgi:hypothetical protein